MTYSAITATDVVNSPIIATLLGVIATGIVGTMLAMVRLLVRITRIEEHTLNVMQDMKDLSTNSDIMRWSVYGPFSQAQQHPPRSER